MGIMEIKKFLLCSFSSNEDCRHNIVGYYTALIAGSFYLMDLLNTMNMLCYCTWNYWDNYLLIIIYVFQFLDL
jgi:hypothetical protein